MDDFMLRDLERTASQMPGGFFVYRADAGEEILYVNDIMLDIFGCDTQEEFRELTGNTFRGLVFPEDRSEVEASIAKQVAANNRQLDYDGRLVRTKEHGDVYCVLLRDITSSHDAREESRRRAKVIEGLSAGFSSIYLLDLEAGTMRPYRQEREIFQKLVKELGFTGRDVDWQKLLPVYADRYVVEEDRDFYRLIR